MQLENHLISDTNVGAPSFPLPTACVELNHDLRFRLLQPKSFYSIFSLEKQRKIGFASLNKTLHDSIELVYASIHV